MSKTLALIPAKAKSDGVPLKNWLPIYDGKSCVRLAHEVAFQCCNRVFLTTDAAEVQELGGKWGVIQRPPNLPDEMLAVVRHALEAVPGPDDEIIVLLQPTSPLRTAETVKTAIQMLREQPVTSVVSVSPSYPVQWSLVIDTTGPHAGMLRTLGANVSGSRIEYAPSRRQDCWPTYKRDGAVYAFTRKTLRENGNIYGDRPMPIHTPPAESISIDTSADWDEAVRRLALR